MGQLNTIIDALINLLVGVSVGVAALMLGLGALKYTMANGNPRQMEEGKAGMTGALIGLGIILSARIIVGVIRSVLPA